MSRGFNVSSDGQTIKVQNTIIVQCTPVRVLTVVQNAAASNCTTCVVLFGYANLYKLYTSIYSLFLSQLLRTYTVIRVIHLGKNSRILTTLIMDVAERNNCRFYLPFL